MTALSSEKMMSSEAWNSHLFPLAAVKVYKGSAVFLDAGYCTNVPSPSAVPLGIASETVDNSGGSAGAKSVNVRLHDEINAVWFANSASSDAIAATNRGQTAHFVDDQTVALLSTGRAKAGIILDVDTVRGVLVAVKYLPVSPRLTSAAAVAFASNDIAIASPIPGAMYRIPTTGAASTVSLGNTGSMAGDVVYFVADGTANGHTVTYRDGSTAISAAATASKRHLAQCIYNGSVWACSLVVGP